MLLTCHLFHWSKERVRYMQGLKYLSQHAPDMQGHEADAPPPAAWRNHGAQGRAHRHGMGGGLVHMGSCERGLWKGRGAYGVLGLPNFSPVVVKPSKALHLKPRSLGERAAQCVRGLPRFLRTNSWYLCVTQTSVLVSTCVRVS